MNKTWKTILQVLGYIISALLGAAGGVTMMNQGDRSLICSPKMRIGNRSQR